MKSKRLEILESSLEKKEQKFTDQIQDHFSTVRQANGQPLNDKRNGHVTLKKWAKQNDSILTTEKSIEKTKDAIEREKFKISGCEEARAKMPKEITDLIDNGTLTQWRKYPNRLFIKGVDKARIIWKPKEGIIAHKYSNQVTDTDQRKILKETYNGLYQKLKK